LDLLLFKGEKNLSSEIHIYSYGYSLGKEAAERPSAESGSEWS